MGLTGTTAKGLNIQENGPVGTTQWQCRTRDDHSVTSRTTTVYAICADVDLASASFVWSSPVASGTGCSLSGSQKSGICSPQGSTNVYGEGFTGNVCGNPLDPEIEPETFKFTQTCIAS